MTRSSLALNMSEPGQSTRRCCTNETNQAQQLSLTRYTRAWSRCSPSFDPTRRWTSGRHLFRSRWGDDLRLWSIYERTQTDVATLSPLLSETSYEDLHQNNSDLDRAMALHHLVFG